MFLKRQLCLITVILLCGICAVDTALAVFSVDFADVGAGDCIIICSDDRVMMIDTGPGLAWTSVDKKLTDLSISRIDLLILTHSHPDHTANLDRILSSRTVSEVLCSEADKESFANWDAVLSESRIKTGTLSRGDSFTFGDAVCDVLWPCGEPSELFNDRSVVMRISYHGFSMLLMGDAESETERYLLALDDHNGLKADLIKLGHHGMNTSSTWPFIRAVSPTYAIASCAGPDHNSSMSESVRETLDECGVSYIFTTAGSGDIRLAIDDNNILTIR